VTLEAGMVYDQQLLANGMLNGSPVYAAYDNYLEWCTTRVTSNLASLPLQPAATPVTYNIALTIVDTMGLQDDGLIAVTLVDTTPPTVSVSDETWEGGKPWIDLQPLSALDLVDGDVSNSTVVVAVAYQAGSEVPVSCPYSRLTVQASTLAQAVRQTRLNNITGVDSQAPAGSVFELFYEVRDTAGNTATRARNVTIVDTLKPALNTSGATHYLEYSSSEVYQHLVTAVDQLEGDITNNICYQVYQTIPIVDTAGSAAEPGRLVPIISFDWLDLSSPSIERLNATDGTAIVTTTPVGTKYVIAYTVTDGAGWEDSARVVVMVVDTTPPTITLAGAAIVRVPFGTRYDEPGFTTTDVGDGNITPYTIVNGADTVTASLEIPDAYTLTYIARDRYNNTAIVTRLVQVEPLTRPSDKSILILKVPHAFNSPPSDVELQLNLRQSILEPFVFVFGSDRRRDSNSTEYSLAVRDTSTLLWKEGAALDIVRQSLSTLFNDSNVPTQADSPRAPTQAESGGRSSSNSPVIAGVGAAVAVLLVGTVACLVHRRSHRARALTAIDTQPPAHELHQLDAIYDVPELQVEQARRPTMWTQAPVADRRLPPRHTRELTGKRPRGMGIAATIAANSARLQPAQPQEVYATASLRTDASETFPGFDDSII
jgi:hypothetical protein